MGRALKVAVTGSHGYIGSVLSLWLSDHEYKVYGCDNAPFLGHHMENYTTISACSFDDNQYIDLILANDIKVIVHLAATSTVGPDATDPLLYYWNNTARTTNFVKTLVDRGWKGHFILASTAAAYEPSNELLREDATVAPQNVYGWSKVWCENVLNTLDKYGIDVTIFRFFNVAGAVDDVGEETEDTHLLSRICRAAITGTSLNVFGNDYPTADGTCIRDYVHVADISRAIKHSIDKKIVGTYNLGLGQLTSVSDMIRRFEAVTKVSLRVETVGRRPGDSSMLVADPSLFRQYGFVYKYTVDDIIDSSWRYFKNGI